MTRTRAGLVPGLLVALALALAVAGCGGGNEGDGVASLGGAGSATSTTRAGAGDPSQGALAYARCMREHGINIPDPKVDAKGHVAQQLPAGVGPEDPKFKAANQACKQYLPNGGEPEQPDPQLQQQMLAFARCMREHGINIPDPKPGGGIDVGPDVGASVDKPKFKAAEQACGQYQPKGGGERVESGPQGPGGG
jgi:hypothetical protein